MTKRGSAKRRWPPPLRGVSPPAYVARWWWRGRKVTGRPKRSKRTGRFRG